MSSQMQETAWSIRRLQARHAALLADVLRPLGLTVPQWAALRTIHDQPDACLHDLAQLDHQSDQAFGALTARMTAAGLLERLPSGRGREVRHRLTAQGERLRREATEAADRALARSLARLSHSQQRELDRLLLIALSSDLEITDPEG
jgi:DNA-binding MarR family transcriptional regulator